MVSSGSINAAKACQSLSCVMATPRLGRAVFWLFVACEGAGFGGLKAGGSEVFPLPFLKKQVLLA
jgi:hypothetical protein